MGRLLSLSPLELPTDDDEPEDTLHPRLDPHVVDSAYVIPNSKLFRSASEEARIRRLRLDATAASHAILASREAALAMAKLVAQTRRLDDREARRQVYSSAEHLYLGTPPQAYTYEMRLIGRGALGQVFGVSFFLDGEKRPSLTIAIKRQVAAASESQAGASPERIKGEIDNLRALSRLPSGLAFYGMQQVGTGTFLVAMERMKGDWRQARQTFDQQSLTTLMVSGCDAVAALEEAGYVHHDLKAANFLYDAAKRTRLGDLAEMTKLEHATLETITESLGTYFPFEVSQVLTTKKHDKFVDYDMARVDRYALGLALIEMRLLPQYDIKDMAVKSGSLVNFAFSVGDIFNGDKLAGFLQEHRKEYFAAYNPEEMNFLFTMIANDHASRPTAAEAAAHLRKIHHL